MNKEEKEAIERLNRKLTSEKFTKNIGMPVYIKDVELVLNLIEKQSKEIEELKKDKLELINKNYVVHLKDVEKELREMRKEIDTKNVEIECLNVIHESYKEMVEENNFISKDKVKEKIETLEKLQNEFKNNEELRIKIIAYKELLEGE